jgi:hypothetical protein
LGQIDGNVTAVYWHIYMWHGPAGIISFALTCAEFLTSSESIV